MTADWRRWFRRKPATITLRRREDIGPDGVRVTIGLTYPGVIRLVGDLGGNEQSSSNGTMSLIYPLCSCLTAESPGRWVPQPPPSDDDPDEERLWDRICRSIDYPPARLRWKSTYVAHGRWDFELEATFSVRDGYSEHWIRQRFTLTTAITDPLHQPEHQLYDRIRWWFHTIARHEVDELLRIDGKQRWDPHPADIGNALAEYETIEEFNAMALGRST